jgi:glycosyltransferase involved in cell wall biosynthesis
MNNLKLSIVIPTADRANTLFYTLQTVLSQTYTNLQIIVSDNNSIDDTKKVVHSFSDQRIKYLNTGRRLGMSNNWEFALSFVDGDFVFFLGDDDGLLPNACQDVVNLINKFNVKAVTWSKANYSWPDSYHRPNELNLSLDGSIYLFSGLSVQMALARGLTSYGRLPNLYTSFVSMNVIREIKSKSGIFFKSVTPDVYSGIVISELVGRYIYSFQPFSINGGSAKSNGQSIHRSDDYKNVFLEEAELSINHEIPIISGSIASCVAEAYLQARQFKDIKGLPLNKTAYLKAIIKDLSMLANSKIQKEGLEKIRAFLSDGATKRSLESELLKLENDIHIKYKYTSHKRENACGIKLNVDQYGVYNIVDCASMISNLLGPFRVPLKIKYAGPIVFLLSRLLQPRSRISKIFPPF